ncbi:MAG: SoxR reducing system RseC family protein [Firmicutes bacterium]|nr:SoxR reducing system RseC family protein [Bacillota bacterium]
MDQVGKVLAVKDDTAEVMLQRNSACEKCGVCHLGRTQDLLLRLPNTVDAEPGQRVLIGMEGVNVVKASLIVYILPVLALVAGFVLIYLFHEPLNLGGSPDLWGAGLGFALFLLTFAVIRTLEPRLRAKAEYNPVIVRVLEDYERTDEDSTCGD